MHSAHQMLIAFISIDQFRFVVWNTIMIWRIVDNFQYSSRQMETIAHTKENTYGSIDRYELSFVDNRIAIMTE